ncbi:TPA: hypothetical protein DIV55_06320 [Patescibacteria group bacterium]|uniref:Polymorphic outer membrane protein n=1 Tax=Candidatus Gottesmanbacteria bacterium GW2011_GWA1_43_11 TaxID=1618436 RepID=A0A0G1FEQ4_9BACT|nr:MAG: hypothetical protein UV59_C0008G0031 [Candidatus Gottesmanbacteria bacterium GW2011_GWA1_43_11]HCS79322.1 hypothetical protein [Patescibacteria group bacterium]
MNKDTIVASIIGFGLGLVAAIALWVVPRILPKLPQIKSPNQKETSTTAAQNNTTEGLTITTPVNGEISQSDAITLKGKAANTKLVVISTADKSQVVTPSENGEYSAPVKLVEGNNDIVVSLISDETTTTELINVFYFADDI